MKNFISTGDIIEVVAPYDVASGCGCLVGSIFGIVVTDALSGAPVNIKRSGVFDHAKTSAQAWTQGVALYWDNSAKVFTTASSGNTLVGAAAAVAANPSATGRVVI
jgi:predicted RecA/RadA family phage recombinase